MWSEGIIANPETGRKYKYWVKRFEEGSMFGIDGGKISKLTIRKVGKAKTATGLTEAWMWTAPTTRPERSTKLFSPSITDREAAAADYGQPPAPLDKLLFHNLPLGYVRILI
jgi:hypothetical protein